MMERVNAILQHEIFIKHLEANRAAEADRRFCCHNMEHFLDVARIGMMINLEEQFGLPKEWVYATALLHDIGKHRQYEQKVSHEVASAEIAPEILKECGFDDKETVTIVEAILHHRDVRVREEHNLRGLLYRADKASRACFCCEASKECNWSDEKKNLRIVY